MRKHAPLLCAAALAALSACTTTATEPAPAAAPVPSSKGEMLINRSEVVAVVASSDEAIDLEQKAARWGYDLTAKESLDGLDLWLLTFDCPPGVDPVLASRELVRLQPGSEVEPNHLYLLQSTALETSLKAPRRYANTLINWPEDGCDALVKVGMIDGAVDEAAAPLSGRSVVSRRFVSSDINPSAREHGTAIAELLVGQGRLRGTTLYSADVVGQSASGPDHSGVRPMLRALDWMVREDVRVVNISLAGPYNSTLERGIRRARDRGTIIVAAVGNQGSDAPPRYPAALDSVIAATAVDASGEIYSRAVRGRHVDVAAPGVDVFVGDEATGRYMSGTSLAAPFVAATLAADPQLANERSFRRVLAKLTSQTVDLGDGGTDPVYGAGLLQNAARCG